MGPEYLFHKIVHLLHAHAVDCVIEHRHLSSGALRQAVGQRARPYPVLRMGIAQHQYVHILRGLPRAVFRIGILLYEHRLRQPQQKRPNHKERRYISDYFHAETPPAKTGNR